MESSDMPDREPTRREIAAERYWSMSRRRFLRGVGACVALPALPSLLPQLTHAAEAVAGSAAAQASKSAPLRMAFVTIPNGVNLDQWWPKGEGKSFELASTMEPLAAVKDQIQVIAGLDHINATAGNDGAGDHARASASLLTGCRAKKTAGSDIHLGPSIDQVAAQHMGHLSRFPSLELTCDTERGSGSCDSGYACAYQYNVSWRSETMPMAAESNPRRVFERLFGAGPAEERSKNLAIRQRTNRSILDFIHEDAKSLGGKLSKQDGHKLEEYLTSLRDIEERIIKFEQVAKLPSSDIETPEGVPENFGERMEVMFGMLALAFQTDSTRVATLMLAHDGSNRRYSEIGLARGHHDLSHHQNNKENLDMIAQIDKFHMKYFGQFLDKLAVAKDDDGTSILHNSMIVYASGNADGNAHSHTNLPVVLAGGGGGKLQAGRFHNVKSMPMSNMYLEMLEHMGVAAVDRFGDSNNSRVAV
jgi:hypothetical protein